MTETASTQNIPSTEEDNKKEQGERSQSEEEEEEIEEVEEEESSEDEINITLKDFKDEENPLLTNVNPSLQQQQQLLLFQQRMGRGGLMNMNHLNLLNPMGPAVGIPEITIGNADIKMPKTAFDIEIENMDDHPWRKPGADVSDYFNYGFNEGTWKLYQQKQLNLRQEQSLQSKIKVYESRDKKEESDLPPELAASFSSSDKRRGNSNKKTNNNNFPEKRRAPDDRSGRTNRYKKEEK